MQPREPGERVGGHSVGELHVGEEPHPQVGALHDVVAEHAVFGKPPPDDRVEGVDIDESLTGKDRLSKEVLIEVAALLLIGGDTARARHDACKVSNLCRLQIGADPRGQDAVAGGDGVVFADHRAVERVLRRCEQLARAVEGEVGVRVERNEVFEVPERLAVPREAGHGRLPALHKADEFDDRAPLALPAAVGVLGRAVDPPPHKEEKPAAVPAVQLFDHPFGGVDPGAVLRAEGAAVLPEIREHAEKEVFGGVGKVELFQPVPQPVRLVGSGQQGRHGNRRLRQLGQFNTRNMPRRDAAHRQRGGQHPHDLDERQVPEQRGGGTEARPEKGAEGQRQRPGEQERRAPAPPGADGARVVPEQIVADVALPLPLRVPGADEDVARDGAFRRSGISCDARGDLPIMPPGLLRHARVDPGGVLFEDALDRAHRTGERVEIEFVDRRQPGNRVGEEALPPCGIPLPRAGVRRRVQQDAFERGVGEFQLPLPKLGKLVRCRKRRADLLHADRDLPVGKDRLELQIEPEQRRAPLSAAAQVEQRLLGVRLQRVEIVRKPLLPALGRAGLPQGGNPPQPARDPARSAARDLPRGRAHPFLDHRPFIPVHLQTAISLIVRRYFYQKAPKHAERAAGVFPGGPWPSVMVRAAPAGPPRRSPPRPGSAPW